MEPIQYPREVLAEDEIMMFCTGLHFALRIERIKQSAGQGDGLRKACEDRLALE